MQARSWMAHFPGDAQAHSSEAMQSLEALVGLIRAGGGVSDVQLWMSLRCAEGVGWGLSDGSCLVAGVRCPY